MCKSNIDVFVAYQRESMHYNRYYAFFVIMRLIITGKLSFYSSTTTTLYETMSETMSLQTDNYKVMLKVANLIYINVIEYFLLGPLCYKLITIVNYYVESGLSCFVY